MGVYIKSTDNNIGSGVFAERNFKKGELVLRATGEILPYQTIYSIQIDWEQHLDPEPPAKFLNHSCNPNLGVISRPDNLPEFFAIRNIKQNEEITFDYAMTEYMHYPRANHQEEFDLTCYCKSENCRGRIGYYSEIDDKLKQKYAGFIADYLTCDQDSTLHPFNKQIEKD